MHVSQLSCWHFGNGLGGCSKFVHQALCGGACVRGDGGACGDGGGEALGEACALHVVGKRKAEVPQVMPAHPLDHEFVKTLLDDFSVSPFNLEQIISHSSLAELMQIKEAYKLSGSERTARGIFDTLQTVKNVKD